MDTFNFSGGERLILLMLCEIQDHLKYESEIKTHLIRDAIYSGNLWGLDMELRSHALAKEIPQEVANEAMDILNMWQRLEESYQALSQSDREWFAENVDYPGGKVRFPGFDGNHEHEYISVTRFLVETVKRFSYFRDKMANLDAHAPTIEGHRRMLRIYTPLLHEVVLEKDLNREQLADVIGARRGSTNVGHAE